MSDPNKSRFVWFIVFTGKKTTLPFEVLVRLKIVDVDMQQCFSPCDATANSIDQKEPLDLESGDLHPIA